MATDHGYENSYRNPGVEYDKTDLGAKGIVVFFVVLAIFAIVMHLVVLGLYAGMTRIAESEEKPLSPLAQQTYVPRQEVLTNTANVNIQQFPEPRLSRHMSQKDMGPRAQAGEMTKMRYQEAAALTAKPWQDAQGNVHLPIEQAMADVLPRLPIRQGATAEPPQYPGAARAYSYPPTQGEDASRPAAQESSAAGQ